MGVNAQNVLVGAPDQAITGAILSAPLGTPLPTSAVDALNAVFADSGYVGPDGVTLTPERSTTDITDWSGALVRRILETFNGTLAWAHLEINEESLKNSFGDDHVIVTPASVAHGKQIKVEIGAHEMPRKSWVVKIKDGKNRVLIVVPDGQVTETAEITFAASGAITLPVTLATYPDGSGNSIYIYTDDGQVLVGSPITAVAVTGPDEVPDNALIRLLATATHANASTSDVTASAVWASSDTDVATVAAGLVAAVLAGTTDLTAAVGAVVSPAHQVTVTATA